MATAQKKAIEALVEGLAAEVAEGTEIQYTCTSVLIDIGARAHPALIAALGDPRLRLAAIRVLAKTGEGPKPLASAIEKTLTDPSTDVRMAAIEALGVLGATGQTKRIAGLLDPEREPAASVREKAAAALGALSAAGTAREAIQERLITALRTDPAVAVRKAAALALGQSLKGGRRAKAKA